MFFSSCAAVKYHGELLNYIDIPVKDIHGKQKQQKRTSTFFEFCQAEKGILLCTDVAARGLDIPGAGLAQPEALTVAALSPKPRCGAARLPSPQRSEARGVPVVRLPARGVVRVPRHHK